MKILYSYAFFQYQVDVKETEGRPRHSLQLPHKGKQRGRDWSPHSGDQLEDLRQQPEAESGEL